MPPVDDASAVRAAYDASAVTYVERIGTEINPAVETPLDRAVLAAFVEMLGDGPTGPVADLGCGPGRAAALVADAGIPTVGLDLSRAMLAEARSAHPPLPLGQAQLADLPLADASLVGVVCWYSVIHTPPEGVAAVCSELSRVLVAGGLALVAFQAGDGERIERTHEGTSTPLVSHRHPVEHVERCLRDAGLPIEARTVREPMLDHEANQQAFVIARKGTDARQAGRTMRA